MKIIAFDESGNRVSTPDNVTNFDPAAALSDSLYDTAKKFSELNNSGEALEDAD